MALPFQLGYRHHFDDVENTTDLEQIEAGLAVNTAPVDRLYRTAEANFYAGYRRAMANEIVPREQHPPLSLLVGLAERFMIGHEYGHGMVLPEMFAPYKQLGDERPTLIVDLLPPTAPGCL